MPKKSTNKAKKVRSTKQAEIAIFDQLTKLAPSDFEKLVNVFDLADVIPGREASPTIRAADLIKAVKGRRKEAKLVAMLSAMRVGTPLSPEDAAKRREQQKINLIGILKNQEAKIIREEIAPYAFSQILRTVSSDTFRAPTGCLMTDIVNHLERSGDMSNKCPRLFCFAVLCRDLYRTQRAIEHIKADLDAWIASACQDMEFTPDTARSILPQQEQGRIPRLAIEIAWPPKRRGVQESSRPEAYARWGIVREQLPLKKGADDARQLVADLILNADLKRREGVWPVDHIEFAVEMPEVEDKWECRFDCIDAADGGWHPLPTCVRLLSNTIRLGARVCPVEPLCENNILKLDDPRFQVHIQKTGVFVGALPKERRNESLARVQAALPHVSIALWSREDDNLDSQDELCAALIDVRAEDVPRTIHHLRSSSALGQVWRNVVLLFDPNLPPFKFANNGFHAGHQKRTNSALI